MTQRCFKCGKRIEIDTVNNKLTSPHNNAVIILLEFFYTDCHMNKLSKIGHRYYCQDCGILVETILDNWENN